MIEKNIYAIYDDDDDTFRVGYLISTNEEYSLFRLYTTRGYDDGFYITKTEEIYRVDYNNAYMKRILKLNNRIDNIDSPKNLNFNIKNLLVSLLNYAHENDCIVTIRLANGDVVTGLIINVNDKQVFMNVINEDGESDGDSTIKTDVISRIWCDSGYERNIQMLRYADE